MKRNALFFMTILASMGSAHASNLLVNGSFEQPAGYNWISLPGNSTMITGWKTGLSGAEWFNVPAQSYGTAADGVMVIDLANYVYTTGGQIEQTFATQAGQSYGLSFSFGSQALYGRDGTAHVDVTVAGITQGFDTQNLSSNVQWTTKNLNFTATGATTTLRFTNMQNPNAHFAYIDAVSVSQVSAVPVPAASWLLGSGLIALAGIARKQKTH